MQRSYDAILEVIMLRLLQGVAKLSVENTSRTTRTTTQPQLCIAKDELNCQGKFSGLVMSFS